MNLKTYLINYLFHISLYLFFYLLRLYTELPRVRLTHDLTSLVVSKLNKNLVSHLKSFSLIKSNTNFYLFSILLPSPLLLYNNKTSFNDLFTFSFSFSFSFDFFFFYNFLFLNINNNILSSSFSSTYIWTTKHYWLDSLIWYSST